MLSLGAIIKDFILTRLRILFKMEREMQELYCNDCGRYLRFKTKPWKNGKLIIVCDHCRHQHCRWVKDGIITEVRWDARNGRFDVGPKDKGVMANSHELSLWEEEKLKEKEVSGCGLQGGLR